MPDRLLDSPLPIMAAPMAGGPSTAALARAVASAGAFPFLAGGYKTVEALEAEVDQLRPLGVAFGVNLFVPGHDTLDERAFAAYAAELGAEAAQFGLELDSTPVSDDDGWGEKLAWLLAHPVPAVSLTFGLPDHGDIAALRRIGSRVLATVTTPGEARLGPYLRPRTGGRWATRPSSRRCSPGPSPVDRPARCATGSSTGTRRGSSATRPCTTSRAR